MASPRRKRKKRKLSPVHEGAAGLDVGSTFHVVAVGADRDAEPVRSYRSSSNDSDASWSA